MRKDIQTRGSPGFTMVELVIVLAVMGALIGTFSLTLGNINEQSRLTTAAGTALSDLRYSQEVAMTERREVNFNVYASSNMYYASYQATGAGIVSPLNASRPLYVTLNYGDSKGVTITSSGLGGRLSFNSDGLPLINGAAMSNQVSVMTLNGKQTIVLYPSGYSTVNPIAGGCGGV